MFKFKANYRSYRARKVLFQKLRKEALGELNEFRNQKLKKNQVDYEKIGRVIAVIVVTSTSGFGDDLLSSFINIAAADSKFELSTKSNLTVSYLLLEILRHLESLSTEISPRLGPGLRLFQKILTLRPECAKIAVQLGAFRILGSILEQLLPHNSDSFNVLPPRSLAIVDATIFLLKTVKKIFASKIGIRCFLRDFIGMSNKESLKHFSFINKFDRFSEFLKLFKRSKFTVIWLKQCQKVTLSLPKKSLTF